MYSHKAVRQAPVLACIYASTSRSVHFSIDFAIELLVQAILASGSFGTLNPTRCIPRLGLTTSNAVTGLSALFVLLI